MVRFRHRIRRKKFGSGNTKRIPKNDQNSPTKVNRPTVKGLKYLDSFILFLRRSTPGTVLAAFKKPLLGTPRSSQVSRNLQFDNNSDWEGKQCPLIQCCWILEWFIPDPDPTFKKVPDPGKVLDPIPSILNLKKSQPIAITLKAHSTVFFCIIKAKEEVKFRLIHFFSHFCLDSDPKLIIT